jgi:carboxylesterase type B
MQVPQGTQDGDNLPVLFYIFGGGFMFGSTAANDATKLIETGIELDQAFIFVGVNYRNAG